MRNFYQNLLIICLTVGTIGSLSTNLQAQCPATPANPVVINEVSGDSGQGDGSNDAIVELAGIPGTNIGGMVISNSEWAVILPAGTVIPANGVFLIACGSQMPPYGGSPGVGLDVGCAPGTNGLACAECDFPGLPINFDVCNPANAAYYDPAASGFTLDNAGANDGDQVVLFNANGTIADAVQWGNMGTTTPGATGGGASGAADNVAVQIGMSYTLGTPGIRGDGLPATGVAVMPPGNCGGTQPTFTMPPISDPRYIPVGANVQGCNTSYQRPVPAAGTPYAGSGTSNGGSVAGATAQWGMLNTNGTNSTSGASSAQFNNANHPNPGLPNNTQAFNWLPPATLVRCTPGTFTFGLNVNNWQHVSGLNCAGGLITTSGATGAESGSTVTVDGTTTTWGSVTPNLATGVTNLSFTTASLSVGTHTVTLKWDDYTNCCSGGECYESVTYTVTVLAPFVRSKAMISCPTDAVAGNINLSQYFSGGNTPYTYALTSGTGATLNATSGVISLPTGAAGPFVVTVNETAPACGAPLTVTIAANCIAAPPPCPVLNLNTVTTTASGAKCPGDIISLCINTVTSTNLPNGGLIDWYVGNSAAFDPFTSPSSSLVCTSTVSAVAGVTSTCPVMNGALVNAFNTGCATANAAGEGQNEFVNFSTGSVPITFANLTLTQGSVCPGTTTAMNGSAWITSLTAAQTAFIAAMNGALGGCGTVFVAATSPIPANSQVLVFSSVVPSYVYTPSSLAGLCGRTIYVAFSPGIVAGAGNFSNTASRSFCIGDASCAACNQTVTYPTPTNTDGYYTTWNAAGAVAAAAVGSCFATEMMTQNNTSASAGCSTPSTTTVACCPYTIPLNACNGMPLFFKAIIRNRPLGTAGTPVGTDCTGTTPIATVAAGGYTVTCPTAVLAFTTIEFCRGATPVPTLPVTLTGINAAGFTITYSVNGVNYTTTAVPNGATTYDLMASLLALAPSAFADNPVEIKLVSINPPAGACAGTVSGMANVSIYTAPTVTIGAGPFNLTACSGAGSSVIIPITVGGTPSYPIELNYTINGSPAQAIVTSSPFNLVVSAAGTYIFTSAASSKCTTPVMQTVVVNPAPGSPTLAAIPNQYICALAGGTINLTALNPAVTGLAGGTYTWYYADPNAPEFVPSLQTVTTPGGVLVTVNRTFWVQYIDMNGCKAVANVNIILTTPPVFTLSETPATCSVPTAIINFTAPVANPVGATYSYSYTTGGTAYNVGSVAPQATPSAFASASANPAVTMISGAVQGVVYWVRVRNNLTGCFTDQMITTSQVTICCPVIGSSIVPASVCVGNSFNVSAAGLDDMANAQNFEQNFGISFVYSLGATAPANAYIGGTLLGTVPFASLTGADPNQMAALSGVGAALGAGTYQICAILAPTPTATTCRPQVCKTIVINPNPTAANTTLVVCDDNTDGLAVFTLTNANTAVLAGQTGVTVTYHATAANATANTAPLASPYTNTTANSQIVFVRVTNSITGCFATGQVTLTVNPLPAFTLVGAAPTCPSLNNATITFTLTSAPATNYTYFVSQAATCAACPTVIPGGALPAGWGAATGASAPIIALTFTFTAGSAAIPFTVRMFDEITGCYFDQTVSITPPAACFACPVIGSSIVPANVCAGNNFNVSAAGLDDMANAQNQETNFGISFVYSLGATAPANAYIGGTSLGTVPFASLTGADPNQMAALNGVGGALAAGTYQVCAILAPTPTAVTCRPQVCKTIVINPNPTLSITQPASVCAPSGLNLSTVVLGQSPTGGTVTFHATAADATAGINPLSGAAVSSATVTTFVRYQLATGCFVTGTITISQTSQLTITAVAECAAGVSNSYNIRVTSVTGGNGGPYTVSIAGQPNQTFSGTALVFGPFAHSGTGMTVQTVTATMNVAPSCAASVQILETLCPQAINTCSCTNGAVPASSGTILVESQPGTFVAFGTSGYTQTYLLVNAAGIIINSNNTGLFTGLANGTYSVYALNYRNTDAALITPKIANGQPISGIAPNGTIVGACYSISPAVVRTINCNTIASAVVPATVCSGAAFSLTTTHSLNPGNLTIVYNTGAVLTQAQLYDAITTGNETVLLTPVVPTGTSTTVTGLTVPAVAAVTTYHLYVIYAAGQCSGASCSAGSNCMQFATVDLVVNPTPTVTAPANQVVCSGAMTTAVIFAGAVTGTIYDWTNNTPSIGLTASGTGNIPAFTATNATAASVTATITVTPKTTSGGVTCPGTPITFTITVNPTPTVTAPANQVVCSGAMTTAVTFMGAVAGTVYDWTNNTPSIGLLASGTGNIPAFTATNATAASVIATITVTPKTTSGGVTCTGTPVTFTITVNPTPVLTVVSNPSICSGSAAQVDVSSNSAGTTITWTAVLQSGTATGFASQATPIAVTPSGVVDISQILTNSSSTAIAIVRYTITPVAGNCPGAPVVVDVTINPSPIITVQPRDTIICTNGAATFFATATGLNLMLQWQASGNAGATWFNLTNGPIFSGVTTNTLSISNTTGLNGFIFRLVATTGGSSCSTFSNAARLKFHVSVPITCNNSLQISLDASCQALVTPDMILNGDYYDSYGVYQVIITTANGTPVPNPLTGAYIGQMLTVSIKDRCDGNSCWGMIKLEDKLAPVLVCPANVTIGCDSLYAPGSPRILFPNGLVLGTTVQPIAGQPNFYTVSVGLDNCGGATLWYNDVVVVTNCQTGNTKIITRTWYARDASGNVSTPCTQTITLRRTSIDDVIVPPNYTGLVGANAPLSCDGTKSISQPTYTVQNFTTTMTLTAHGAWQQVCGGSTPVVVSNVPVVTYVCRDTAFYIDANGLIIRSYLVPVVNNPLPADTIFWAKLPNGNPAPTPVTTQTVNGIRVMGTGEPSGIGCGTINYTYSDLRFDNVCGTSSSSFKILRVWKIVDWCTGAIRTYEQTIKVLDTKAPEITCPANVTVSTDAGTCSATYTFAPPTITDNCDAAPKYDVSLPTSLIGIAVRNTPIGVVPATYSNIPQGIYPATYTATDACGNTATCNINISVEDLMPPNPICREFTQIALGFNGQSNVLAKIFDAGSTDNCGIVKFQASRDYQTGCSGTTAFQDTVMFTCCDLSDTVNVTLRVYDRFNNQPTAGPNRFNDCMVQVFVEDKLPPVVSCPPSFTVDCGQYDFTNNNIGGTAYQAYFNLYFGSVQKTEAARITRNVDVINAAGFAAVLAVKDGIAYDNCAVNTITDVLNSTLTNCGVGTLTRTFTVSDKNGRTASCAQQITVVNKKPFNGNTDITWPSTVNITNKCHANVHPDTINSRPRVREDGCDITAVTYTDEVFTVTGTFCQKILRKWKVLDWCQYNPSNPSAVYIWEKTQTINVTNTVAPTIAAGVCKDTIFCQAPTNCAPLPISLSISATDDCTPTADIRYSYSFDINNDGGALILGNGNTFTGTYPFGTHRISWSAEDGCGNVRTCSYKVTIDECKKPTPICKIIIAELMPATSMVAISTVQVNNTSYDNCAVQYIKLRRVAQGSIPGVPATRIPAPPTPTGNKAADKIALNNWALANLVNSPINADTAIFTCLDRKFGGGMGNVQLWVGDNNGNWDFCQTGVILQNNMGAPDCGEPAPNNNSAVIAGEVHTELNAMVQDVQIKVASPNNPILSAVTSVTGIFNFQNLLAGANYTVTPEKDINPLNGVTTYDLVLIQKHILGVAPLGSPYKIIAADVNRSGGVSTIDMVELRKMILHIDDVFANNTSWRFVKADYQFPDPSNPWTEQFPEISAFSNSGSSMTSNFVGVKIGDVNMSATPNNLLGTEEHGKVGTALFEMNEATAQSGETIQVAVKAKDLKNLQGYQFALNFDARMMAFVDVASNCKEITKENFGLSFLNEGIITTSWNGKSANLSPESVLFTLSFKAKSNLRLSDVLSVSSKYTVAEAYTLGGELLDVAFAFANSNNNTTVAKEKFELYQNQPNPFKGKTVIGFNLPKADQARLVIFDNAGRLIKEIKGDFAKGYNEVTLDESELKGAGILEYRLETSDNFAVKRMIILE